MTVPTMRPDHDRPTASRLVSGAIVLALIALSGAADAAGPVEVDLGSLDALPPATAGAPGAVRLHPPTRAKNPPVEHAAPAAKPAAKSSLHVAPLPAPAPDSAATDPAEPAPARRDALATPSAAPPPAPATAAPPALAPPAAASPLAALPPQSAPAPAAATPPTGRLLFTGGGFDLSGEAKAELDGLTKRLAEDARLYLQLVAYAGGGGDGSEARRLSLSRALAARSYLLDHGVDGKQVDVRPLGNRSEAGLPPDRVDCVVATR
jgi:outer membrane protein OmpA-like peptidoglycan-associated protein